MKISSAQKDNIFEMAVSGRLDAYWSGLLDAEIEKAIHNGKHRISIDASGVEYISSAGLRILLKTNNKLKSLDGKFIIRNPSQNVVEILNLTGFCDLFRDSISTGGSVENARIPEMPEQAADSFLKCTITGSADFWNAASPSHPAPDMLEASEDVFAIGIGAFGSKHEACRARYGEFIAAAGAAAYLPTDNAKEPDYMISSGDFIPKLHALFSIKCEGKFSRVFSFEQEKAETTPISEICSRCRELTGSEKTGLLMVAEIDGLAGAFLRKSPCEIKPGENIFSFPGIKEWLSFTPEKAHSGKLALVCGVTGKSRDDFGGYANLADREKNIWAHLHAAIFSYSPMKQGKLELSAVVRELFSEEKMHALMHLINDNRIYSGAGESAFSRGICWTAPIGEIIRKGF